MSFFDSMFGGGGSHIDTGMLQGMYNSRLAQINDFSNQLASQRTAYQNQYQNFAQQQFLTQLMPNMAAQFAGRGLAMNGGAYSAELARQAASAQGGMINNNFQAAQNDAMAVNNAQGSAWNQYFGGMGQANMYNAQVDTQNQQAMGRLVGTIGGAALGTWMGGPIGNLGFGQRMAANLGYNVAGMGMNSMMRNPFSNSYYAPMGNGYQPSFNFQANPR